MYGEKQMKTSKCLNNILLNHSRISCLHPQMCSQNHLKNSISPLKLIQGALYKRSPLYLGFLTPPSPIFINIKRSIQTDGTYGKCSWLRFVLVAILNYDCQTLKSKTSFKEMLKQLRNFGDIVRTSR